MCVQSSRTGDSPSSPSMGSAGALHSFPCPSLSPLAVALPACSFILYVVDIVTDAAAACHLVSGSQYASAAATVAWPLLAAVLTALLPSTITTSATTSAATTTAATSAATTIAATTTVTTSAATTTVTTTAATTTATTTAATTTAATTTAATTTAATTTAATTTAATTTAATTTTAISAITSPSTDATAEGKNEWQRRYFGGLLHRYIALLYRHLRCRYTFSLLHRSATLSHLQQATLQSAPQLLLQLHLVMVHRRVHWVHGACIASSLLNLFWVTAEHLPHPSLITSPHGLPHCCALRGTAPQLDPGRSPVGHAPKLTTLPSRVGDDLLKTTSARSTLSLPATKSSLSFRPSLNCQDYPPPQQYPFLGTHFYSQYPAPAVTIRQHKLGSDLTGKERSLLPKRAPLPVSGKGRGGGDVGRLVVLLAGTWVLLAARLVALAVATMILGPWLYMTMCVHLTVMFVLVVSERPVFSPRVWEDVLHCLAASALYCFSYTPVTERSATWRASAFQVLTALENTAAVMGFFMLCSCGIRHRLSLLLGELVGMALGLLLLLLHRRLRHHDGGKESEALSSSRSRCGRVATIALSEEDTCSTDADSGEDSDSCSSPSTGAPAHGPLQPGLMCSVQDLLANMSCLDEPITYHGADQNTDPTEHLLAGCRMKVTGDGVEENLVELQDVVVDCSNNVRSANILPSSSFTRDFNIYGTLPSCPNRHANGQFRTSADYENYPLSPETVDSTVMHFQNADIQRTSSDVQSHQAISNGLLQPQFAVSPSSFERSVTRELDERLTGLHEAGVSHDVSSLTNSPAGSATGSSTAADRRSPQCREDGRRCNSFLQSCVSSHARGHQCAGNETLSDVSISRAADTEIEMTVVTDNDLNMIGVPATSPSSLYTSHNDTATTVSEISTSVHQTSAHRPAMLNVEYGVIKKLPSIRRKGCLRQQIITESDYGNGNHAMGIFEILGNREDCSVQTSEPAMRESADRLSSYSSTGRRSPPLPLPPRTYIIRCPYTYFPETIIKSLVPSDVSYNTSNHDYENIPPLNVNRAMLGVRHWKTYFDIENRIHDYSTFRDRSKVNSTTLSSVNSELSSIRAIPKCRPLSIADDLDSVLSRSLPDLSTLVVEACIKVPAEEQVTDTAPLQQKPDVLPDNTRLMAALQALRASKPSRTASVDDLSNYETIWVSELEDSHTPRTEGKPDPCHVSSEHSSLINTISDVRAKGSLCNLYYSTMSDLSRRFYSESFRPQTSAFSLASGSESERRRSIARTVSVPDGRILDGIKEWVEDADQDSIDRTIVDTNQPQTLEPMKPRDGVIHNEECFPGKISYKDILSPAKASKAPTAMDTVRRKRKFSILRDRFEGPLWTPLKSPLKLHSPARALQAGMRAFNRPRVHVITPSEDAKEGVKLTSPFKGRNILKSRATAQTDPTDNIEIRIKQRDSNGTEQIIIKNTPLKAPTSASAVQTPKTSTPDHSRRQEPGALQPSASGAHATAEASNRAAPKHSTPEAADRHLPQISTISGLSSVVESPELSRCSQGNSKLFGGGKRVPLSENIRPLGQRSSMAVIQEVENVISSDLEQARLNAIYSAILSQSAVNIGRERTGLVGVLPAQNQKWTPYALKSGSERDKENVYPVPYGPPYGPLYRGYPLGGPYSTNDQRSTLAPNSKIFDKKL